MSRIPPTGPWEDVPVAVVARCEVCEKTHAIGASCMTVGRYTLSGSGGTGKGTFPCDLFTQAVSHNARTAARRAIRRALAAGVSPAELARELLPAVKPPASNIPTLTDQELARLAHGLRAWPKRIPLVRG